jgi:hypothetical protein
LGSTCSRTLSFFAQSGSGRIYPSPACSSIGDRLGLLCDIEFPAAQELVQRARELIPLVAQRWDRANHERCVAAETVAQCIARRCTGQVATKYGRGSHLLPFGRRRGRLNTRKRTITDGVNPSRAVQGRGPGRRASRAMGPAGSRSGGHRASFERADAPCVNAIDNWVKDPSVTLVFLLCPSCEDMVASYLYRLSDDYTWGWLPLHGCADS